MSMSRLSIATTSGYVLWNLITRNHAGVTRDNTTRISPWQVLVKYSTKLPALGASVCISTYGMCYKFLTYVAIWFEFDMSFLHG